MLHEILPFALFFVKKQLKKHDVPFKKTVTFCENFRFFAGGFFWNTAWNLTFCPIFCQKTTKKTRCTLQKNRYVLWFFFLFLLAVFPEILHEILPFAFCPIFVKKQLKKHDVPFKKTATYCENYRFFADGFFWKSAWKLTFCPIFVKKQLKKHDD